MYILFSISFYNLFYSVAYIACQNKVKFVPTKTPNVSTDNYWGTLIIVIERTASDCDSMEFRSSDCHGLISKISQFK